eukprot:SAG31_NODE_5205_length_2677_cov_4.130334_3_plen_77_part_00
MAEVATSHVIYTCITHIYNTYGCSCADLHASPPFPSHHTHAHTITNFLCMHVCVWPSSFVSILSWDKLGLVDMCDS